MRKRTKIIVYLSPEEKELIQAAADYTRRTVSNFVKNATLSEATRNRSRLKTKSNPHVRKGHRGDSK